MSRHGSLRPIAAVAVIVLSGLTSCRHATRSFPAPHACTEVGCTDSIAIDLGALGRARPFDLEVCAGAGPARACERAHVADTAGQLATCPGGAAAPPPWPRCRTTATGAAVEVSIGSVPSHPDLSGRQPVDITISRPGSDVVAHMTTTTAFERRDPNGPDCPPACWFLGLRLTPSGAAETAPFLDVDRPILTG